MALPSSNISKARAPRWVAFMATCLSLLTASFSTAQHTLADLPNAQSLAAADDAFAKEKYALAIQSYDELLANGFETGLERERMEYRAAMCAVQLYMKDAPYRVAAFVQAHPENPAAQEAWWELGDLHYRRRHWKDAVLAFNEVDARRLKQDELLELRFKRGHSLFEKERYDEARGDLFPVVEAKAEFHTPALYYFSHISYIRGQAQVALEGFQALAYDPEFEDLVPVYIAQLLHETEQYDALIQYAPALLDSTSTLDEDQSRDIARLLGDALYRQQDYTKAHPRLEAAWNGTRGPGRTREFAYQVGFTRHELGLWREGLNALALVTREDDGLAQNAIYHMAGCYLGLVDKDKARTAFRQASEMHYDAEIREDALFSHARLAFELSHNPFDDAITAIERYVTEYPNSARRDEAYGFLLEVYLTSKDYERALKALDKIEEKDAKVQSAYQLVAFNRGVELFRGGDYADADAFFALSRTYKIDPALAAESHYWQGELNYLLHRYTAATGHYAAFTEAPGGFNSSLYDDAEYARGYALFKRKKYVDALTAFRSFLQLDKKDEPRRTRDAKLRTADCFYVLKSFDKAAALYAEIIGDRPAEEDYAQFKRAQCLLLQDLTPDAIQALYLLIQSAPESSYVPEARYSAARALIESERLPEARNQLESLLEDFPHSSRTKYALVDLCLVGVKQGKDDEVLALWDRIRTEYGTDPVAGDAFNVVEPLLIDRGLLDNIPSGVGLDGNEIEDRLYHAARDLALARECERGLVRLGEYIRQYDQGRHLIEAHFFLGNCAYDTDDFQAAGQAFAYVLDQPTNDFTEPAAVGAATIAWNAQDLEKALGYYRQLEEIAVLLENKLEARIGQMRCLYLLDESQLALPFADQVIEAVGTPDDIRRTAMYWRGKIRFENENWTAAYEDLQAVATFGGARGAECKYLMVSIAFQRGLYEAAETEIFELVDQFATFDDWKFKAFVLLVRVYIGMEDLFQARTTAESILDYSNDPEILSEVQSLLEEISLLEKPVIEPEAYPADSTLLQRSPNDNSPQP